MYIYRNTRTGVEISTLCPVGGEWELVTNTDEATDAEVVADTDEAFVADTDEVTVAEVVEEPTPKPKRKRTTKK